MEGRLLDWMLIRSITARIYFLDRWMKAYNSILFLKLSLWSSIKFIWRILWWYLGQQYINRKEKFFYFSSVSPCSPLFPPISSKMMLRYLKSSSKKYSKDMRRSNSFWLNWKKQQRHVELSVQFRKQEKKQRPKWERKPRKGGLKRKRKHWNTSNNSRIRY